MANILVVDDDPLVLKMLMKIIGRAGYNVWTAENGREALQRIQEESVDLMITDIVMPEKEGIETIAELKKIAPEVKVIAISGGGLSGTDNYLLAAQKLGAARVLAKPFHPEVLLQAIEQVLGPR